MIVFEFVSRWARWAGALAIISLGVVFALIALVAATTSNGLARFARWMAG